MEGVCFQVYFRSLIGCDEVIVAEFETMSEVDKFLGTMTERSIFSGNYVVYETITKKKVIKEIFVK